ncbi:MAG: protein-export chaperone SecB [Alphaproteobacteria bacterium]|nr:protein-export chaperone SecB [Alphaproteobacteria bacterium]MBP1532392.1 protein-export chaperone SecB [Alphaproteobacteria bacterium]
MAKKENKTTEETATNNQQLPALMIHSQYIKDMSLEIPLAPEIFQEMNKNPDIHVDISMNNKNLENNVYNVTLTAKIDADLGEKKLFIVELSYAAVVSINVPAEQLEPVLYIELPRLLFPYVRSIISNSLSAAGLPPIMLNPIDFVSLYNARKAQQAQEQAKKSA